MTQEGREGPVSLGGPVSPGGACDPGGRDL